MEIYFTEGKFALNMILRIRKYLGIALYGHLVMLQVTQSFQVVWACMQNECIFFHQYKSVDRLFSSVTIRVDSYYTSSVPYFGLCVLVLFRYFALKELSGRIISLCAVISTIIKGQTSNNHPAHVCH